MADVVSFAALTAAAAEAYAAAWGEPPGDVDEIERQGHAAVVAAVLRELAEHVHESNQGGTSFKEIIGDVEQWLCALIPDIEEKQ